MVFQFAIYNSSGYYKINDLTIWSMVVFHASMASFGPHDERCQRFSQGSKWLSSGVSSMPWPLQPTLHISWRPNRREGRWTWSRKKKSPGGQCWINFEHGNFPLFTIDSGAKNHWDKTLVGGFKHFLFSIIYGMSSFPLTFTHSMTFQDGWLKPPTRTWDFHIFQGGCLTTTNQIEIKHDKTNP